MLKNNAFWNIVFLLTWLFVSWHTGIIKTFEKHPMSVHQAAQTDRASIALNYYQESMNLFLPRVHESRNESGIVGCELPIVNYITAVSYKVFGFDDRNYRIINWLIFTIGMFAVFRLFYLFTKNYLGALLFSFLWYLSPILVYYTGNYLPDTASLSLNVTAFYFFVSYLKNGFSKKRFIAFLVFALLAALIKVTSLILPIAITIYLLLSKVPLLSKQFEETSSTNKYLLGLIGVFLLTLSWYQYSNYLNTAHRTHLFFLTTKTATSFNEFMEYWKIFYSNWLGKIYVYPVKIGVLSLALFFGIRFYSLQKKLVWISIINLGGIALFFILMAEQYRYHDYYIICLLTGFLLMLSIISNGLFKLKSKIATYLILGTLTLATFYSLNTSRKTMISRYEKGNHWEQTYIYQEEFEGVEEIKKKFNITREEKIFVAYDNNPNVILYFLNLKGYRIAEDTPLSGLRKMYRECKPRILVVTDPKYFDFHPEDLKVGFKRIASTKKFTFYELDYSNFD